MSVDTRLTASNNNSSNIFESPSCDLDIPPDGYYKQERIHADIRGVGLEKRSRNTTQEVHSLGFPDAVSSFIQGLAMFPT